MFSKQFTFPLAVVDGPALEHNLAEMARYCAARGVVIAPHGKTTMSPEIAAAQLAAGAFAITVATVTQALAYHRHGVQRVLVANEVTDPGSLDWLLETMDADPAFAPIVCADSVAAVRLLAEAAAARAPRRPLDVLIELGHPGGRTGARTIDDAVEVGREVQRSGHLRGVGVTGYEGTLGHAGTPAEAERVHRFCLDLLEVGRRLVMTGALPQRHIVSAAGSLFFTEVCDALAEAASHDGVQVVLRSGAYAIHDHGLYDRVTPSNRGIRDAPTFRPTTTIWAPVLSVPEQGLAILLLGRRDVGFDQGLPAPLRHRGPDGALRPIVGAETTELNDQHAFVRLPEGYDVSPGDLLQLGISHPCTTFDKWQVLPVVDGEFVVDLIHTFF
ncbi:alanine racemase [Micromonospora viridifaciens]|uniref:alanine racemase n=1 Tax=Micromonospora viridifaciens TaxID=1881 RepID=UPI00142DF8AF|nr:alanine racemase [Micromonospora viridifaciens]